MSGYPTRPGRDDFGPEPQQTRAVVDPNTEMSAALFSLMFHQVSGMGLLVPRVMFEFVADVSPTQVARSEAWNPKGLTATPFDNPGLVRNNLGDYTVTYTSPVPDQLGNDIPIAFQWGYGFVRFTDPTAAVKLVQVAVDTSVNALRVGVFDAANALEDGNTVVIFGG